MSFLEKLGPGDRVIVSGRMTQSVDTVARITKTQIVMSSGNRFNRSTGRFIGGDRWTFFHLSEATTENLEAIARDREKKDLVRKLNGMNWNGFTLEQLRYIVSALPEDKEEDI